MWRSLGIIICRFFCVSHSASDTISRAYQYQGAAYGMKRSSPEAVYPGHYGDRHGLHMVGVFLLWVTHFLFEPWDNFFSNDKAFLRVLLIRVLSMGRDLRLGVELRSVHEDEDLSWLWISQGLPLMLCFCPCMKTSKLVDSLQFSCWVYICVGALVCWWKYYGHATATFGLSM